jgi:hypothetical protein
MIPEFVGERMGDNVVTADNTVAPNVDGFFRSAVPEAIAIQVPPHSEVANDRLNAKVTVSTTTCVLELAREYACWACGE